MKLKKCKNKILLGFIALNILIILITILHIGILVGLGASIGTLAGFVLSFTSVSCLTGGIIASVSMLSASAISDRLRYYSQNDYVDIIIPDINRMTKPGLDALGFTSSVNSFIKISAYFAIGTGLVAFGFMSPTAIGALTATVFSVIHIALLCIDKVFPSKRLDSSVSEVEISQNSTIKAF